MKTKRMMGMLLAAAGVMSTASASENGVNPGAFAYGIEGQGYFDLPPPGTYLLNYTSRFKSTHLADGRGDNVLPGAAVDVTFNTFRFSHFPKTELLGAQWRALELFLTVARSEFSFAGRKAQETGLADIGIDPFGLAWKNENSVIGFSTTFSLPTGKYDQDAQVNLGRNYVSWTPQFFYTRYLGNKWGDLSVHSSYEYNFTNTDGLKNFTNPTGADYQSGQAIHTEVALSKHIGNLRLGGSVVGGYQFTRDRIKGSAASDGFLRDQLDGNRYRKVGVGLSAMYLFGGYAPVWITYTKDVYARNTAKGNQLTLKFVLPLSM